MLVGEAPSRNTTREQLTQILNQAQGGVPRALQDVVVDALAANPAERQESIGRFGAELQRALSAAGS
jgi:hypothetical protein